VACRSVTASPAKTAKAIEMPFGLRTWVDPGNHDGVPTEHDEAMSWQIKQQIRWWNAHIFNQPKMKKKRKSKSQDPDPTRAHI